MPASEDQASTTFVNGAGVSSSASAIVTNVSSTASTNGSGITARKTRLMMRPNFASMPAK
jgi:hypothetical protein